LAFLALTPSRFEGMGTPPESYSVELIAPSAVGGTHFPGPLGLRPEAPPQVAPAPPPRPAEPKGDGAKEPPAPEKAVQPVLEPPPAAKAPDVAKVSEPESLPAKEKEAAKVPEVKKPEVPAAPGVDVAAQPDKKEVVPPQPEEPAPPVKKAAPKKEKVEPKAEAQKDKPKVEAKKDRPDRSAATTKKPAEKLTERDKQIAAAVQRRAAAANAESSSKTDPKDEVDRRIAAAVQRRTIDAARAASGIGSSGSTVAGVGPGSGVGGAVRGIEYVMYRNRMESRIKAAWVWAGADRSLRAVVRFNVTVDGKITNVKTVQSSGDVSYDASVERAIRAADPLGPPPEQYREEFGIVELEFRAEDARG